AVSDVGVAALLAQAALRSALLNVEINLRTLQDPVYLHQVRAEVERVTSNLDAEAEHIHALVLHRVKGA
ncbi:MAG: formiminotransferase-cyclodeaminase, partial [Chloroflexi bacterium]